MTKLYDAIDAIRYAIEDLGDILKHVPGRKVNTHPVEIQYYKTQLELAKDGLTKLQESNDEVPVQTH